MRAFLKFNRYAVGCFWTIFGVWLVALVRYPGLFECAHWVAPLVLGPASLAAGCGLFFDWRWARILTGCLAGITLLYSVDMILFLMWRGYHGQSWVSGVLCLLAGALCTWFVLLLSRSRRVQNDAG